MLYLYCLPDNEGLRLPIYLKNQVICQFSYLDIQVDRKNDDNMTRQTASCLPKKASDLPLKLPVHSGRQFPIYLKNQVMCQLSYLDIQVDRQR